MVIQFNSFKLASLTLALIAAGAAQANSGDYVTPLTGNTSSPSNWHFLPGQSFNGVAGALDGVARLTFTKPGGVYACSGSLLAGGAYVLTAAHCADSFSSMKVDFGWANGSAQVSRSVAVKDAIINPHWNGDLDTGADMALLRLSAPVTGINGYHLSTTNDIGKDYLMAGYGTTSVGGSNGATNWNDRNFGHYGYNTFDVDSQTFNKASEQFVGTYDANYYAPGVTYMSDFDSGANANNTLGRMADLTGNKWSSSNGLGSNEALIAGGDSGGGDFVWNGKEWLLSAVHSWGWQGGACSLFNLNGCDVGANNASSFGDLSGSTATYSHIAWINQVTAVPEPETYAMMLSGIALLGALARRRKQQA
ncbi:trypsin-like serine protease [Rugamonas sp. CCM 8940]|uniref:trypsin-like serine protease n=1 Tax=Rugamonas sp. CCM 8940 TaxID=2765359 RepID=UPI0018F6B84B|nr:trypsin-like serine protease [Rugamonas sp. CCM 8940]MBJ7311096.1 trypsin-like serine protease [Rugamonas sp. CCM 8940]